MSDRKEHVEQEDLDWEVSVKLTTGDACVIVRGDGGTEVVSATSHHGSSEMKADVLHWLLQQKELYATIQRKFLSAQEKDQQR